MTTPEAGSSKSSQEIEKNMTALLCEERKSGTKDNPTIKWALTFGARSLLEDQIGKIVTVRGYSKRWAYNGPESNEDYSESDIAVEGKLHAVSNFGIEVAVEK